MNTMHSNKEMHQRIERQTRRLDSAERQRPTLLRHTIYLGTLGLLFVLPLVAGAYLGHWLDSLVSGYSIRWTMSLIVLGLVIGAVNVYLFIRDA
ncbi:MAG: AtpZ/AtpI family protein [Candidatus Thiodiazotropha sp.]|jgi:ATP synthase protein I